MQKQTVPVLERSITLKPINAMAARARQMAKSKIIQKAVVKSSPAIVPLLSAAGVKAHGVSIPSLQTKTSTLQSSRLVQRPGLVAITPQIQKHTPISITPQLTTQKQINPVKELTKTRGQPRTTQRSFYPELIKPIIPRFKSGSGVDVVSKRALDKQSKGWGVKNPFISIKDFGGSMKSMKMPKISLSSPKYKRLRL